MKPEDLKAQLEVELELIEETLGHIERLREKIGDGEPDNDQLAAAGAYLASLYSGIENTLKRIARYRGVPLPEGPNWHVSLLRMFGPSQKENPPTLMNEELLKGMGPYLGFRHLFMHGYAILLRWDRLSPNLENARKVFSLFVGSVAAFLETECPHNGSKEASD